MPEFQWFGRILLTLGLILIVLGSFVLIAGRIPGLGRLPGDIFIRRNGFSFYFPLATCLVLSILLSLIFTLVLRR